jgi:PncC family amidohydrolase
MVWKDVIELPRLQGPGRLLHRSPQGGTTEGNGAGIVCIRPSKINRLPALFTASPEGPSMQQLIDLAGLIADRLKARGETAAVAESSAGGLITAALLAVPGASAYFLGGAVVYTRQARRALLAIPDEAMAGIRSASEPYAALLARTVRERHGATWGLAETGAAGPTGNRYGDPAGHACIAVSGPAERVLTLRTASPDRQANMQAFAAKALETLLEAVAA